MPGVWRNLGAPRFSSRHRQARLTQAAVVAGLLCKTSPQAPRALVRAVSPNGATSSPRNDVIRPGRYRERPRCVCEVGR